MKPSPLQLSGLEFIRVHVEVDLDSPCKRADEFDFDGRQLAWSIDHGREATDDTWWVAVGFATNQGDDEPRCPYLVDVQAIGVFSVSERMQPDRHEKLVYENGAAIIYSAIREMITNVTARSMAGPLVIPSPTFMGAFEEREEDASSADDA
jgi:preprotein translocase subunit SecB